MENSRMPKKWKIRECRKNGKFENAEKKLKLEIFKTDT